MFVGYSLDHPTDTYCFLNLSTKGIIYSRDVKWLDKTWGQYYKIPTRDMVQEEIEIHEENENQETMPEKQEIQEQEISYEEPEEEEGPIASRTWSQVEQPISSRTSSQTDVVSFANIRYGNNTQEWLKDVAFVTGTMCDPNEPQTFQHAWWNSDKDARETWHETIRLEFNKKNKMGVWREVNKVERNANKRLVGSKWVFKIKRNYRVRLVAKYTRRRLYRKLPRVINDMTFRIVQTRNILEGLDAKVIDINNAFLNGDLDHEIFMKMPEGYKECIQDNDEGKAIKLDKAIYGLVQAARQFWKKLTSKLKEAGFEPSNVDLCLFQCNNDRGLSTMIMYIDDLLIIGKPETNENTINDLK